MLRTKYHECGCILNIVKMKTMITSGRMVTIELRFTLVKVACFYYGNV